MNTNQLPRELSVLTLEDMEVGETGYVLPHQMVADRNGDLFLKAGAEYRRRPIGSQCLEVRCTVDGYVVEYRPFTYQEPHAWRPQNFVINPNPTHTHLPVYKFFYRPKPLLGEGRRG